MKFNLKFSWFVICVSFFTVIQAFQPGEKLDSLKAVIVLFRHGDRTPIQSYPNDPYNNLSYWPVDWGQLTNTGKLQQYKLGQWLREIYDGFLPQNYSNFDIFVRSTDVDRTLMSAESNLAGLYPPTNGDAWLRGLKWQPIPIHTIPEKEDAVMAGHKSCPKYDALFNDLFKSGYYFDLNLKLEPIFQYLRNHTGVKNMDIFEITHLFSTLYIEELYNYTLPNWTHEVYPDKLKEISAIEFAAYCYTEPLKRLKIGLLLNEWVTHFESVLNGQSSKKLFMYSGHDTTLANVLMAFNAFNPPHLPPYCGTIILELHNDNSLKIWYKNGSEPVSIESKTCSETCSLDVFKERLQPVLIDAQTWQIECFEKSSFFTDITISLFIVAALLAFSLTFVITRKFMQKKKKTEVIVGEIPN